MLSKYLDLIPDDFTEDEASLFVHGVTMYLRGWFPMFDSDRDVLEWVQGEQRAIVPLDDRFNVSRSLRTKIRRNVFEITTDRCFERVIRECGVLTSTRDETWLHEDIVTLFKLYHRAGMAHSIEAWVRDAHGERVLVGGLYGVALGRIFCGESMFSRPELGGTDASKVCLAFLVNHLRERDFVLLDAQLNNEHMQQFGTYDMPREQYVRLLRTHAKELVSWDAPPA